MNIVTEINHCSVCNSNELEIVQAKEMRNGWRDKHDYKFCLNCEFLEIINIPKNISKYYENGYYTSFKPHIQVNGLRALFWALRAKLYTTFMQPLWNTFAFNTILDWKHKLGIHFSDDILDYGCGNGDILFEFHKHGFKSLLGVDPFLPNINVSLPFELIKGNISEIVSRKPFKLIMMHHSFEHMPDQKDVLTGLKEILGKGGKLFIRMPVINEAFYTYRENWVQIDAPRHFGLHSVKSFTMLSEACGFKITEVFFDSTEFQFTGSEQNRRDIAFFEDNSIKKDLEKSIFTQEDRDKYGQKAIQYNKSGKGDQAGFILELK